MSGSEQRSTKVSVLTVLEESGEDAPEDVRELVLRGGKWTGFEPECATRLSCLQVLSLSHNNLRSVAGFKCFEALLELNLNFNQVVDLTPLQCPKLRKLFLSNNAVVIVDRLQDLPELHTLCLFRNHIFDLNRCLHTLLRLPNLKSLDLAGNPCMAKDASRHQVVRTLPTLKRLDGDELTALDRELADMGAGGHTAGGPARPSTAPAPGRGGGGGGSSKSLSVASFGGGPAANANDDDVGSVSSAGRKRAGEGVAAEYMAQAAMVEAFTSTHAEFQAWKRSMMQPRPMPGTAATRSVKPPLPMSGGNPLPPPRRKGSRSGSLFVDRIRGHRSPSPSPTAGDVSASRDDPLLSRRPLPRAGSASSTGSVRSVGSSSSLGVGDVDRPDGRGGGGASGPQDTAATIRRLVSTIELLKRERDDALAAAAAGRTDGLPGGSGGAATDEDVQQELLMLRIENQNLLVLKQENQHLRQRVKDLETALDESPLRAELAHVKLDLEELQAKHRVVSTQAAMAEVQRPRTAQEALEECAEFDEELADLMLRNQRSLQEMRASLSLAKTELGDDGGFSPPAAAPSASTDGAGAGVSHTADVWVRPDDGPPVQPPALPPRPSTASGDRLLSAAAVGRVGGVVERPTTANLLGRPLTSMADVEAAYEAVAVAQLRKSNMDKQRQELDRVLAEFDAKRGGGGGGAAAAAAAAAGDSGPANEEEDDDDGSDGSGDSSYEEDIEP